MRRKPVRGGIGNQVDDAPPVFDQPGVALAMVAAVLRGPGREEVELDAWRIGRNRDRRGPGEALIRLCVPLALINSPSLQQG